MAPNESIVIEGEVHFVDVSSSTPHATVYVQLVDVTLADAPSEVITEEVIYDVSIDVGNPLDVPFSIRAPSLDERATYTLMVHVDVSGSGDITLGDYITMESYPVSPSESLGHMQVQVRQVK